MIAASECYYNSAYTNHMVCNISLPTLLGHLTTFLFFLGRTFAEQIAYSFLRSLQPKSTKMENTERRVPVDHCSHVLLVRTCVTSPMQASACWRNLSHGLEDAHLILREFREFSVSFLQQSENTGKSVHVSTSR